MGVPKEEAEYYEGEVRGGRTLVTVKAPGRYDEAQQVLRDHDAYDVETRDRATAPGIAEPAAATTTASTEPVTTSRMAGAEYATRGGTGAEYATSGRTDYAATAGETVASERDTRRGAAEGETMQLREEQLQARKQTVEAGQVNLGKEVVEEQRSVEVPVTREEVFIDRHPVDRPAADQPIRDSGQTVEVPVREEQVEVSKQPVVYEEVGVGKRQVTEQQQVSDTVRREEARVETEGNLGTREPRVDK
jgi:uncharacterized protein (TIGR02271 family)